MNYLQPGLQELARMLSRSRLWLRILLTKRALAKAETALGLLGWQQADFDDKTQAEVDKLNDYERRQAQSSNAAAEIARELVIMRAEREQARKTHTESLAQFTDRRETAAQERAQAEEKLKELRKAAAELERRLACVPNERGNLRRQQQAGTQKIQDLERRQRESARREADAKEKQRELQSTFAAADAHLAGEIRQREREKTHIDKEIEALEAAKAHPYRRIGQELADSGIPPLNQPHALHKVNQLREGLRSAQEARERLQTISAAQHQETLQLSLFLFGVIVVITTMILLALIPLR